MVRSHPTTKDSGLSRSRYRKLCILHYYTLENIFAKLLHSVMKKVFQYGISSIPWKGVDKEAMNVVKCIIAR